VNLERLIRAAREAQDALGRAESSVSEMRSRIETARAEIESAKADFTIKENDAVQLVVRNNSLAELLEGRIRQLEKGFPNPAQELRVCCQERERGISNAHR
jgi:chromosome segregation ATPase